MATIGPSSWDSVTLQSVFDAGADVFRLNYSHGEPEQKKLSCTREFVQWKPKTRKTCILADLPGPKLRLGEFSGVRLLNNGDNIRLLCGKKVHDGDELPVEYDGLSSELKSWRLGFNR